MSSRTSSSRKVTLEQTNKQSGKNRGSKKSGKKSAPPEYSVDTPSESSDVESDILSELDVSENEDQSRPVPKTKSQKGTTRNKKKEKKVAADAGSSIPPYMMMLTSLNFYSLNEIEYVGISTFTPSCWSMYSVLDAMHDLVGDNTSLRRFCPYYHVALSNIYYGIIWIIQILRANQVASNLSQADFQFLRFFESNFALEELPVAGPLVLFFQNLAAHKPDGNRFNWTVPYISHYGPNNGAASPNAHATSKSLPQIPQMISLLQLFGASNAALLTAMDAAGQWEPFTFAAGGTIAGFAYGANMATDAGATNTTLGAPGINLPWQHDVSVLRKIVQVIRRMNLPTMVGAKDTPRQFCGLDASFHWFHKAIGAASQEAKYFAGSTSLANINPSTGPSAVVVTHIAAPAANVPARAAWYEGYPFNLNYTVTTSSRSISETDVKIGTFSATCASTTQATLAHYQNSTVFAGNFFLAADNPVNFENTVEVNPTAMAQPTLTLSLYRLKGGETNADD